MGDDGDKSKTGQTPVIDNMSPYFISNFDNPGQIFVGELLRDGNYGDWINDMTNALFAKNKIGFVDGTINMLKNGSTNLPLWKRCDAMVKGWLTSAMDKEIRSSVKYATTAREMWMDLKERFGKESAPRAYELRRMLISLQQENLSVSAYYTKLRNLWDEANSVTATPKCLCGGCKCNLTKEFTSVRERERLYDFLMGLNDEFSTIKTQILSTKPSPTLGSAYHLVAEDERQRQITASHRNIPDVAAFQVQGKRDERKVFDRRREKKDGKDSRWCSHCNTSGHMVESCFEIIRYPEWWTGEKKMDKRDNQGLLLCPPNLTKVLTAAM